VERAITETPGELATQLSANARQMRLPLGERMHQTIEQLKQQIDAMGYEELLRRWRFAKAGDPCFQGEMGTYYQQVIARKRVEVGEAAHTAASKAIGW
jgi:hypothetical protein